jgi:hypothetical protein
MVMANPAAELASASAWRRYLLLHRDVSEDDDRLTTLNRYVYYLCEGGENNPDTLLREGLLYLRKLDELGEERDKRLARYRALEEQTNDQPAAPLTEKIAFSTDSQQPEPTETERRLIGVIVKPRRNLRRAREVAGSAATERKPKTKHFPTEVNDLLCALDQKHCRAIYNEIGDGFRRSLAPDRSSMPSHLRRLLDRLTAMDAYASLTSSPWHGSTD